ncbi:MAG: hypothetical protein ACYS14_01870 [Planctomycetota bacterium]|jgi:hypothetical protein
MTLDDTIQKLGRIQQSVEQRIPKTAASPDALVNHLNDLYGESTDGFGSDELFTYDDVGSPSITLTVHIDVDFDPKRVMDSLKTKLQATPSEEADDLGTTGAVWSCGRYDFVHDDTLGQLRISHRYSHRQRDTQSVLSIMTKMMDYATSYLEAAKQSAEEATDTSEKE